MLDFLQSRGREFVESRAKERNGSNASPVLQWRFQNGIESTGCFERVIHSSLNHVHSEAVTDPVYSIAFSNALIPTGSIQIPGTGLRRVAIRVRGVAPRIPNGTHTHVEGQAQRNRFGVTFKVQVNTDQIGGHYVKRSVTFMPDVGFSFSSLKDITSPTSATSEGAPRLIGLNTFEGIEMTEEARKMDRIIYFSVDGSSSLSQSTRLGWLSSGVSGVGDGIFQGGPSDALMTLPFPLTNQLGTYLGRRIECRNENGLNVTSLKYPNDLMFSNPINSIGLDVKIMGYHADTAIRPVIYRELPI